ncbi:hypothetical protein [Brevibacillus fortis]|uniref:Uncharacterized protein n=1 Tax=Brevibacillus fortis TaxID=2126352 RepID=A0A2P7VH44_9BACL|nr:hypothetical protein [Brevibacillus fortis]PSJ98534.1 hypothetical protein C7R93_06215 [Brevibacillus fortis]
MSNFKDIVNQEAIPHQYRENAKNCFMCNSTVVNGGTWAGTSNDHLVTVCSQQSCQESLISWAIDTFLSSQTKDIFTVKDDFLKFEDATYNKKANKSR